MFKVTRFTDREFTVFAISGRLEGENLRQLRVVLGTDLHNVVLDLEEVSLAGREGVRFLARCQKDGARLQNCPAYIRGWIARERGEE